MPLIGAECKFVAPAQHGDRCEVRSRISRFGGASFVVAHEIARADGTRLAHGTETRVWARYVNGPGTPIKSQPIPDEVRELFRAK